MAVDAEHNLIDTIPRLTAALVHAAHLPHHDLDAHAPLAGHIDEQAAT